MPKRIVPLSDLQVSKAKPKDKNYKLQDGYGLYLVVTTTGGKLWRYGYSFDGRQKTLSLGPYPALTLAEARELRAQARKLLVEGVDPSEVMSLQAKKQRRQEDAEALKVEKEKQFEFVACEWHQKFINTWTSHHADKILRLLERDIFPFIGKKSIDCIEAPELLALFERIAARPALDAAHRARSHCGAIFRYAIATGKALRDPTRDLFKALPPVKHGHRAAPTDPKDVAPLLRIIDEYSGHYIVKCALQLLPMLFCRPGELRGMEWAELDLEAKEWRIPAGRMKMKQAHLVPLPDQAIKILESLKPLTGHYKLVFPGTRSVLRCISDNTLNAALRRMGVEKHELTSHGWRATARTILHEVLGFTPDAIEAQLAHVVPDRLGRAYNRTTHLAERRKMMQQWADYLDGLKTGAKVIPIRQAG